MSSRIDYRHASPAVFQAMLGLEKVVAESSLEQPLRELVRLRASQLNGCAYCCDMHTREALKHGEDDRRLHTVAAWRECEWFSPRERAALAWTESLTLLPQTHAPDEVYRELAGLFSAQEQTNLTLLIIAINGWNRIAVGFRIPPAK